MEGVYRVQRLFYCYGCYIIQFRQSINKTNPSYLCKSFRGIQSSILYALQVILIYHQFIVSCKHCCTLSCLYFISKGFHNNKVIYPYLQLCRGQEIEGRDSQCRIIRQVCQYIQGIPLYRSGYCLYSLQVCFAQYKSL